MYVVSERIQLSAEPIASGAFGEVYRGQIGRKAEMALKVIKNEEEELAQDFMREVRANSLLKHRNIVCFYGVLVNTQAKSRMMIFEWMPGGSLKDFLLNRKSGSQKPEYSTLTISDLLFISVQLADAVGYLHEKGLVHRDLAARNCLVSSGFVTKLADFGLSREVDEQNYYKVCKDLFNLHN